MITTFRAPTTYATTENSPNSLQSWNYNAKRNAAYGSETVSLKLGCVKRCSQGRIGLFHLTSYMPEMRRLLGQVQIVRGDQKCNEKTDLPSEPYPHRDIFSRACSGSRERRSHGRGSAIFDLIKGVPSRRRKRRKRSTSGQDKRRC